jgi:molybdopterin converting factor small subunit
MQIEVRLFAMLRDRLPPGSGRFSCTIEVQPDTTVQDVLDRFEITPEDAPIHFINGLHAKTDVTLKEGDVLAVFPPIAGG